MDEGLARLEYLLEHGALGMFTGPSGVGKSALIKRFLHGVQQQCETVYCHLTHLPSSGLLKLVAAQLGETPRRGKERLYEQILERANRTEATLLLIFDEAHLLNTEALIDLRLLISSALDVGPPLKILLAGQESLRATLKVNCQPSWPRSVRCDPLAVLLETYNETVGDSLCAPT